MNSTLLESVSSDKSLDVSDWLTETRDGRETCSLCVYYDRFGFGMSLDQVQQAVAKLDVLLTRGESSESGGEIQIDRGGTGDGCVMIAFRHGDGEHAHPAAEIHCRHLRPHARRKQFQRIVEPTTNPVVDEVAAPPGAHMLTHV